MLRIKSSKKNQSGATLVEFAIAATVFLTAMFAVLEFGRALWTHNALADAARRGARYGTMHGIGDMDKVKNVVVFGNPEGTGTPLVSDLSVNNVDVEYSTFGLNGGTVEVSINDYEFQLVVPIIGTTISMPNYTTTLTAECAGYIPANM